MRNKLIALLVVAAFAASATIVACGGTEVQVQTVVVERVVTQAPEVVVETVEVEVPVERVVTQVQTVEVEVPVERVVVETVVVEATAEAMMTDDSMMMDEGIPRNRQLVLMNGGTAGVGYADHDIWNIYGGTGHQLGPQLIYEPLAYYSAFNDTEYLWLAESYEYNNDFTSLTIKTRKGINWSDGTPFGAHDVHYTIDYLSKNPGLKRSGQIQRDVESVELVDDSTVVVNFKGPRPRFFYFMSYKFDIGVHIVPKHVFDGQDWLEFPHFDLDKGWPVTTGVWEVVQTSPQQRVMNRRDSWWALDQGLVDKLPEILQIVYVPNPGETQRAQAIIANRADAGLDFRPRTMAEILERNANVITHSGFNKPYGYVDWWPIGLMFNASKAPYDDKRVRWAISNYLDRDQIVEVAYIGAGTPSQLPIPSYAPLQRYFDVVEEKLSTTHNTSEYNPTRADSLMMEAGFEKNSDGYWERDGSEIVCDILGVSDLFDDIGPIMRAQLDRAGIRSSYSKPPDAWGMQTRGEATCALRGHGGSVRDPYYTLNLYRTSEGYEAGEGHQINAYHWSNPQFDEIIDQVAVTGMSDYARLEELWGQAMDIWLEDLPDVQVVEWYHRIAMNTTYWTNWPTHDNPYTNGAFWHMTFPLIVNSLVAVEQ